MQTRHLLTLPSRKLSQLASLHITLLKILEKL